jgi:SAM-dependent methyltransferase
MPQRDDLTRLQTRWERLAREDPLWAVLTDPAKKGGAWDVGEFFRTGEREIEAVMAYVDSIWPGLRRARALDFGCGVGRLTQALAGRFERVVGVDISPTMIELARAHDRSGGRCEFLVNDSPDLALLASADFDFAYSNITLQHVPPAAAKGYLRELVRVLRPGGLLVFQLPTHRLRTARSGLVALLPAWLRRRRAGGMEMHALPRHEVEAVLRCAGARLIDAQEDASAGPGWPGLRYAATRRA